MSEQGQKRRRRLVSKAAIISEVAKTLAPMGFTRKDIKLVMETFQEHITNKFLDDRRVRLLDFGVLEIIQRRPRKGRNPQTGEPVDIPQRRAPKFRLSKTIKDLL